MPLVFPESAGETTTSSGIVDTALANMNPRASLEVYDVVNGPNWP